MNKVIKHGLQIMATLDPSSQKELRSTLNSIFADTGNTIDFNSAENRAGIQNLAKAFRSIFTAAGNTSINFDELINLPSDQQFAELGRLAATQFWDAWNSVSSRRGNSEIISTSNITEQLQALEKRRLELTQRSEKLDKRWARYEHLSEVSSMDIDEFKPLGAESNLDEQAERLMGEFVQAENALSTLTRGMDEYYQTLIKAVSAAENLYRMHHTLNQNKGALKDSSYLSDYSLTSLSDITSDVFEKSDNDLGVYLQKVYKRYLKQSQEISHEIKKINTEINTMKQNSPIDETIAKSALKTLDEIDAAYARILNKNGTLNKTKSKNILSAIAYEPGTSTLAKLENEYTKSFSSNENWELQYQWLVKFVKEYEAYAAKANAEQDSKKRSGMKETLSGYTRLYEQLKPMAANAESMLQNILNTANNIPLVNNNAETQAHQEHAEAINAEVQAQEKLNAVENQNPPAQSDAEVHNANANAIENEAQAQEKLNTAESQDQPAQDDSAVLQNKLALLKQISAAYVKRDAAQDKYDNAEGEKASFNAEQKLNAAQEAVEDFQREYHSAIVTMQDGSKINIPLDEEFAEAAQSILANAKQIQNIDLIPRSAEPAIQAYEMLERAMGNVLKRWKDPNTLERALGHFSQNNVDFSKNSLNKYIESIKELDPNFQYGSQEIYNQAVQMVEKLNTLGQRITLDEAANEAVARLQKMGHFKWDDTIGTHWATITKGIREGTFTTVDQCIAKFKELANITTNQKVFKMSKLKQMIDDVGNQGDVTHGQSLASIGNEGANTAVPGATPDVSSTEITSLIEEVKTLTSAINTKMTGTDDDAEKVPKQPESSTQQNDGDTNGPWALEDTLNGTIRSLLEDIKNNTTSKSNSASADDSKLASAIKKLNDTLSKGIVYRESGEGTPKGQDDKKLEKLKELRDGYIELGKLQAKYEVSGNIQAKEQAELLEKKLKAERAKIKSWATAGQTSDLDHAKDKGFADEKESLLNKASKQSKLQNNIDTQFDALVNLEKELQSTGSLSDELKERIERLFDTLQKVKTSTDLSKWKEEFGLLGSDFDSLEEAYKELGRLQAQKDLNPDGQEKTLDNQIAKTKKLIESIEKQLGLNNELYEPSRVEAYNKEVEKLNAKQEKADFKQQVKFARDENRVSKANATWRKGDDTLRSLWKIDDNLVNIEELSEVQKLKTALDTLNDTRRKIAESGKKIIDPSDARNLKNQSAAVDEHTVALKKLIDNYEYFSGDNSVNLNATLSPDDDVKAKLESTVKAFHDGKVQIQSYDNETQILTYTVKTGAHEFTTYTAGVRSVDNALRTVKGTAKTVPTLFESIRKKTKEIFTYFGGSSIVYKAVNEVRKGIQYVREIDSALTELKKVTDETEESYERFLDTASKTAGKIGSTISDFTRATATFAKLGYDMTMSSEMAEAAVVYQNVGDGIESADAAAESIISTIKGFNLEASESMRIVDRFNEVGNRFSITSKGIGDALQRSASALSAGGNTLDESIGLITAANEVVQDPTSVGTALKTLSLRLRGAKTELEEAGLETENMAETTATLQKKLLALTGGKVDIMLDANTFKSSTQILREMSAEWENMTDIQQAAALELMGGKRQANILSSIITNFDTVESVIEASANSSNSALEENAKWMDSIEGKIHQFTNAYQAMWSNMLSSDIIKRVVDLGTGLVKIVDQLGLLGTALAAVALYQGIKAFRFGDLISWISLVATATNVTEAQSLSTQSLFLKQTLLQSSIVKLALAQAGLNAEQIAGLTTTQLLSYGIKGLGLAIKNLWIAIGPIGWAIVGITVALTAGVAIFDALTVSAEEASEQLKETKNNISTLESELESLKTDLDETRDKIAELIALPSLSLTQQEDLDRLEREVELLERQIALKERQLALEEAKLVEDTKTTIKTKFRGKGNNYYAFSETEGIIKDKWNTLGLTGEDAIEKAISRYEKNAQAITEAENLLLDWDTDELKEVSSYLVGASGIETNDMGEATRDNVKKALEEIKTDNINIASSIEDFFNDPDYAGLSYGMSDEINDFLDDFNNAQLKWEKVLYGDDSTASTIESLWGPNASEETKAIKSEIDKIMAEDGNWANDDEKWKSKNDAIKAYIESLDETADGYHQLDYVMNELGVTAQDIADYFTVLNGEFNSSTPEGLMLQYQKGLEVLQRLNSDKTKIEEEMKKYGEGGNVDLLDRPKIDSSKLAEKGWEDVGDGTATVFSSTFSNEDESVAMNFTPILPDGSVLSPSELEQYANDVINGAEDVKGLKIGATFEGDNAIAQAEAAAERIHNLQDVYYLPLEVELEDGTVETIEWEDLFDVDAEGNAKADMVAISKVMKGTSKEVREEFAKLVEDVENDTLTMEQAMSQFQLYSMRAMVELAKAELEVANKDAFSDIADDISGLIDTVDELSAALDNVSKSMDLVHTAQQQMNSSGQISLKTALDLMASTDQWNQILDVNNGKITLAANAEQILIQSKLDLIKANIETALQEVNTSIAIMEGAMNSVEAGNTFTNGFTNALIQCQGIMVGLKAAWDAFWSGENVGAAFNTARSSAVQNLKPSETNLSDLKQRRAELEKQKEMLETVDTTQEFKNNYDFDKTPGDKYDDTGDALEALQKRYERQIKNLEAQQTYLENEIERLEALNQGASVSYYKEQISLENNKLDLLEQEREALLSLKMNDEVADALWEVEHAIQESTLAAIEFGKAMHNAQIEAIDGISEAYDAMDTISDNRMQNLELYKDGLEIDGNYASEGLYNEMIRLAEENVDRDEQKLNDLLWAIDEYRNMDNPFAQGTDEYDGFEADRDKNIVELHAQAQETKNNIREGVNAVNQLREDMKDTYIEAWDGITEAFDNIGSFLQNQLDFIDAYEDRLNTLNINVPDAVYEEKIDTQKNIISNLDEELAEDYRLLEEYANKYGTSDARYIAKLQEVTEKEAERYQAETQLIEYQQQIFDNQIDRFNQVIDRINDATQRLQNMSDLIGDEDVATADGEWTDEGLTRLGMAHQQMAYNKQAIDEYAQKMEEVEEAYKNGEISEKEYYETMKELSDGQWDAINSYEEAKDAIVELEEARIDMIEEGLNKEAEAYQELIDLKKEELDAERDLYDFKKNIEKQTKDIAALERRIASMSGSSDASTIAERTRLEKELREAKDELDGSYRDHAYDSMSNALDDELDAYTKSSENYIKSLRESIKETDLLIEQTYQKVLENTDIILQTIVAKADEYGFYVDEYLTAPWENAQTESLDLETSAISHIDNIYDKVNSVTSTLTANVTQPWKEGKKDLLSFSKEAPEQLDAMLQKAKENQTAMLNTTKGFVGDMKGQIDLIPTYADAAAKRMLETAKQNVKDINAEYAKISYPSYEGGPTGNGGSDTGDGSNNNTGGTKDWKYTYNGNVKTLQDILVDVFGIKLPTYGRDGKYGGEGGETWEAVRKMQKKLGVTASGKYDETTSRTLESHLKKMEPIARSNDDFYAANLYKKYYKIVPKAMFAKGTLGTTRDQLAITDESWIGEEITLAAGKNGQLQYLKKGSAVMPADISANLVEWGKLNPNMMGISNVTDGINLMSNYINKPELKLDIENFLKVDRVDRDTLPELEKLMDKKIDTFAKQLNASIRKFK